MGTAQVVLHTAPASYGGWTTTAAAEMGGMAGLMVGCVGGIWLIFRDEGRWAGTALTWLWVGALLLVGCLGFVAFS